MKQTEPTVPSPSDDRDCRHLLQTDAGRMARTLLEIADAVEQAERRIKREILRAAETGDARRVAEIVTRWLRGPVADVLPDGDDGAAGTADRPGVGGCVGADDGLARGLLAVESPRGPRCQTARSNR